MVDRVRHFLQAHHAALRARRAPLGIVALLLLGSLASNGRHSLSAQEKGLDRVLKLPPPGSLDRKPPENELDRKFKLAFGKNVSGFIFKHVEIDPLTPLKDLLPVAPKTNGRARPHTGDNLTHVPEVQLQAPLAKDRTALRKMAQLVANINHLNRTDHDGFLEALLGERADLRGLPVAMGDACRTQGEQSRQFKIAANTVSQVLHGPNFTNAAYALTLTIKDADAAETGETFWEPYRAACDKEDKTAPPGDRVRADCVTRARIAALTQMLAAESPALRLGLAKYLSQVPHVDATRALARLAIFSAEDEVRRAALGGLKVRRERDYTDILLQGLRYPLPVVAKRTGEALVQLQRTDLIPQLVDLLDEADPRAPVAKKVKGKQTPLVRELVKINHHRNCLLCHAPAGAAAGSGTVFTAPVPTPDQPLNPPSGGYGSAPSPMITVRLDVTYLRQDFSVMQPVTDAQPWPEMQRFDFFVRTRSLTEEEADAYRTKLAKRAPGTVTPYQRAALHALRELTGKDAAPTAEAWRELLGLQSTRRSTPTLSVMAMLGVD